MNRAAGCGREPRSVEREPHRDLCRCPLPRHPAPHRRPLGRTLPASRRSPPRPLSRLDRRGGLQRGAARGWRVGDVGVAEDAETIGWLTVTSAEPAAVCPRCGLGHLGVVETRWRKRLRSFYRRRECSECGWRVSTFECIDPEENARQARVASAAGWIARLVAGVGDEAHEQLRILTANGREMDATPRDDAGASVDSIDGISQRSIG